MRKSIGTFAASLFFLLVASGHSPAQAQTANLHISGSGSATATTASYSVSVVNNGPDSTDGVVVGATTGLASITSVNISQGTCTISGNSFSCNVGTVASGGQVSLSVTGQLPNFGLHHPAVNFCGFSISVSGSASDPDTSDNSTTVCVQVPAT